MATNPVSLFRRVPAAAVNPHPIAFPTQPQQNKRKKNLAGVAGNFAHLAHNELVSDRNEAMPCTRETDVALSPLLRGIYGQVKLEEESADDLPAKPLKRDTFSTEGGYIPPSVELVPLTRVRISPLDALLKHKSRPRAAFA